MQFQKTSITWNKTYITPEISIPQLQYINHIKTIILIYQNPYNSHNQQLKTLPLSLSLALMDGEMTGFPRIRKSIPIRVSLGYRS